MNLSLSSQKQKRRYGGKARVRGKRDEEIDAYECRLNMDGQKDAAYFTRCQGIRDRSSGLVLAGANVRAELVQELSVFDKQAQEIRLDRSKQGETLVSIRLQFVPRIVGNISQWKLGIRLQSPSMRRVFAFHAGCHDGQSTWTLYALPQQMAPFNLPADFQMDRPATLELSMSEDGRFAACSGVDSNSERPILLNQQGENMWRLADSWDAAIVSGWADGHPYRVEVERIELAWAKVRITGVREGAPTPPG